MISKVRPGRLGTAALGMMLLLQGTAWAGPELKMRSGSALSAAQKARIVKVMGRIYDYYQVYLPLPKNMVVPYRLFKSKQAYRTYQKKHSKTRSSTGYYSSKYKELVVYKHKNYLKTLQHESQHFILRSVLKSPPKWLNEGMSEFYELAVPQGKGLQIKLSSRKTHDLKKLMLTQQMPPLKGFVNLDRKSWSRQPKNYAISWGLIYFLKSTPTRKKVLGKVISALHSNPRQLSSALIDSAYPGGFDAFERDFALFFKNPPEKLYE